MPRYRTFGLVVETSMPFDGLAAAHEGERPHVRVQVAAPDEPPAFSDNGMLVGSDPRSPCFVQWWQHAGGDRITHTCAGSYALVPSPSDGAVQVIHYPAGAVQPATLRMDLLARLLPLVLHRRGVLCLHASAVDVNGRVIALVAHKGTGKSTMAMALIGQGAVPVADDALAISLDSPVTVWPGVRSVRVRPDSQAEQPALRWNPEDELDGKFRLALPETGPALDDAVLPLDAIYVLEPAPADVAVPVQREVLSTQHALMALLGQGKLGPLLGGMEAATEFGRMATLAASVPVYALTVARDLARVNEAARIVASWHAPSLDVAP